MEVKCKTISGVHNSKTGLNRLKDWDNRQVANKCTQVLQI